MLLLLDAIAMEAGVFCDIADVNPHPEFDPPICRNFRFPLGHSAIAQHGNFHRAPKPMQTPGDVLGNPDGCVSR